MAQKVNGDVIERLQDALLSAFSLHDLIRLTRIELDANLEEIVPLQGRNLQEITYDLVRWCGAQENGINRLVAAAHRVVPDNPEVNEVYRRYADVEFMILPAPDDDADNTNEKISWHRSGSIWLSLGVGGGVALFGLGYLLLLDNPVLMGVLTVTAGFVTTLLGFLGLKGDKSLAPRLSQWIGSRRFAQLGMGSIMACALIAWLSLGWPALQSAGCDPGLGCKEPNERWFAIGDWGLSVEGGATPADQLLADSTRRTLYEKLSLATGLRGISTKSPQVSDQVKANLDYWIEGDHTRSDRTVLTAEIHGPGGEFLRSVSAEGPANLTDLASDICILDLQNQLALGILDALSVEVNDEIRHSLRNVPTDSCEALLLNNEAVQLALDDNLYRAELLLRDALSLDPAYSDAHSNLGWVLRRQDDLAGAIEAYETAVELNTFNPLGHFNLGLAYELDGRLTKSIDEYQSAIDLDPAFYQAFNNMGFTYLQMGQLDRAEQALKNGLRIDEDRFLYKNLGRVYLAQGNNASAVEALGNALRLSDGLPFPEAQYYLAVALTELDMDDRACDALRDYGQISDLDTPERIEEAARLAERLGCN